MTCAVRRRKRSRDADAETSERRCSQKYTRFFNTGDLHPCTSVSIAISSTPTGVWLEFCHHFYGFRSACHGLRRTGVYVGVVSTWYGSKLNQQGTAGFGPCFYLPGFHFGYIFLTHSHVGFASTFPVVCGSFGRDERGRAPNSTRHKQLGDSLSFPCPLGEASSFFKPRLICLRVLGMCQKDGYPAAMPDDRFRSQLATTCALRGC